jgi:hypothetical protein
MASIDLRAWALSTVGFCVAGCAGEAPPVDDAIGGTEDSTSVSDPEPEPEPEPEPVCVPLAMTQIEHVAFDGDGCSDAPSESMLLTTQDEVDAHTDAYCQSCCEFCSPQVCPKPPKLAADTMIIYAYAPTPHAPADAEILAVEECGDAIKVSVVATAGCETAFNRAWDAVVVPTLNKPVEFDIELVSDPSCNE